MIQIFKRISAIALLLFLAFPQLTYAQRFKAFSNDPDLIKDEVRVFAQTVPKERQKEAEALIARFDAMWDSQEMTDDFRNSFIEAANMMLRKNMRFFPHFESFVNAYSAFIASELTDYGRAWQRMLQYHVNNDVSSFSKLMENYARIFNDNVITQSPTVRWTAYGLIKSIGMDGEPYVEYEDIDLVGAGSRDSVEIIGTSGRYFPSSTLWKGGFGTVYWYRAGLSSQVRATFKEYSVDTRQPKMKVENAMLYYPDFFNQPIAGVLEDKATLETDEEKVGYPRFRSYEKSLTVRNIYDNVDYIGGFELRGASVQGYASEDQLAQLNILKNKKVVVSVLSLHYLFKEETVRANDAHVNIYVDEDSIYHPSANFYYNSVNSQLLITRPKYGVGRSPFFDTYHRMDITAETISWNMETDKVEFKPLASMNNGTSAKFESQNFFNNATMRELLGSNKENPLFTLWKIFKSYDFKPINFEIAWKVFNHPEEDVKALLIQFAADGFVEYDVNADKIYYRKKIAQYLNNDVNKKDYDNIVLESQTHYAALDMQSRDLTISGCEWFVLSEAQIVNVYPQNNQVIVRKNRDMEFSGRIVAGLFDFISHKCNFNYEDFNVRMENIDSLVMYVEDKNGPQNMYGEYKLTKVQSPIEDIGGILYIDKPTNKSGRYDIPKYPYFSCTEEGRVYYDHPFTFNRHYDRTKFYFALDLFTITNLDNFDTDSIRFAGQLVSGGIFPDIRQELKVRPDFSLGFIHQTGDAGLPAYLGKGNYAGCIDLSNRGLRGKGRVDYLTSTSVSDSLVFFLDKMTGSVKTHEVREQLAGVEYPPADLKDGMVRWEALKDQMYVYTGATPMNVFRETELTGNSVLTPEGMYGTGTVNFKRADISSKWFAFKHHELLADAADLRIYDLYQTNEFVFSTDNYKSHIDFQTRKGHFVSNGVTSEVLFQRNQFKTNAAMFDWDPIDEDVLTFKWEDPYKDVDIDNTPARDLIDMESHGNELTATNSTRHALQFTTTAAEFNFKSNVINAHGVRYINVGDAAIIPHHGDVTIYEKAVLDTLREARIVADREDKYHELYNCTVGITHAQEFKGYGDYDYVDMNKEVQVIHFDAVWFYETTKGDAKIPFSRDFKLSPHFGFDGRVELNSANQFLTFIGGVELIHDCDTVKYARMRVNDQIDPDHVLIQIGEHAKDVNDRKVVVAIASTNTTGRIYTCFGAAKEQFNDSEYITATGYIDFDEETQCFRAASLEKLENPELPENIITLSKTECISRGSGTIDMGAKLGRVDFATLGTVVNYMKADSATMSLTTTIDFFFNENAMKIMNKHIDEASLDFIDPWDNEDYQLALKTILPEKDFDDYSYEINSYGQSQKLPAKMRVKFVFANISFTWDKEAKAFISQHWLPVVICNAKEVNKEIPGEIVIEKRGSRNRLYLYFETDEDEFFFFQVENNSIYGYSSDTKFNDAIVQTKVKKRMLPGGNGLPSFTYKIGNRSQKNKFMKKFYRVPEEDADNNEE
ncbi:MAG: hypothetical protein J5642_07075 [Bacteroidales bacterium]|nr:hypothetical protein [Bacteroidales bacterium]